MRERLVVIMVNGRKSWDWPSGEWGSKDFYLLLPVYRTGLRIGQGCNTVLEEIASDSPGLVRHPGNNFIS